jgi:hypothetical protein
MYRGEKQGHRKRGLVLTTQIQGELKNSVIMVDFSLQSQGI